MSRLATLEAGPKGAGFLKALKREFTHPNIRWAYIFMLPGVIWLFALHFFPILRSFYYSLTQWSGLITEVPKFVGLANYRKIFGDRRFWQAVLNTGYYVLLTVPVNTIFSMIIAVLMYVSSVLPATRILPAPEPG